MKDILRILIAPLVWLASFSAIYALQGFMCGNDFSTTVMGLPVARLVLVAAYICAIVLQGVLLLALYSSRFASSSVFVRFVSRSTGWVGLVATVWSLFPVVMTTLCAQ